MADDAASGPPVYVPSVEQTAELYEALGRAIADWQLVESALYRVYHAATLPAISGAAAAGFHAIQTFNLKLQMTDMAVQFTLVGYGDLSREWALLKSKLNKKNQRRNEFAHFPVHIFLYETKDYDRIRVRPHLHDTRFFLKGRTPEYRAKEIRAIAERFRVLAIELSEFAPKLQAVARKAAQLYK